MTLRWRRRALLAGACAGWATGLTKAARAAPAGSERVLEEARSPYNHVVVTEQGSVRTMYFVVEGTWFIESRLDRAHAQSLDLDYTRTMMAGFLVQPQPRSIAMLGFGGGQMSNYLFHHLPGVEIDGVDLDPEVVRLARKWFEVPESPRYRTHAADGRVFLERGEPGRRWDMIVLDAFRGVFVPYHLKTREFYAACLARLTPGGVVVANLHDGSSMHRHDRATFAAVFPTTYGFTSESRLQTSLVASAATQWLSAWHLRANARAVQPTFDFDLEGLAARLVLDPSVPKGGRVLSDDFDPRELGEAAARHNESCREDCAYPTR